MYPIFLNFYKNNFVYEKLKKLILSNFTDGGQQRHLLSVDKNCTAAAIDEFPEDFFTQDQRARGGVVIHFLISIYLFYVLAIVCDDFFVPSLECICDGKYKIQKYRI